MTKEQEESIIEFDQLNVKRIKFGKFIFTLDEYGNIVIVEE